MSETLEASCFPYHRGMRNLTRFLVVLALLVVTLGGKTKSQEAGLTIADPVTFRWMPQWLWTANISAEYSHRIVAFLLACSTLALMVWVLRVDKRSYARKLAVAAFIVVVCQAVLGALTVKYLTRAQVSIPHAVMGQTFFALACALACIMSATWNSNAAPAPDANEISMRKLGLWLLIAVYIQLFLGAALRHDDKAAALRDGRAFVLYSHLAAHILGAFYVIYRATLVIIRVFRQHRAVKALMKPTHWLMMLIALQLTLGIIAAILKITTGASYEQANDPPMLRVVFATAHQAVGAVLLGLGVVITLFAWRLFKPVARQAVGEAADAQAPSPLEASM